MRFVGKGELVFLPFSGAIRKAKYLFRAGICGLRFAELRRFAHFAIAFEFNQFVNHAEIAGVGGSDESAADTEVNGRKLQDRLYLGLGISARLVGQFADAFRPAGVDNPLSSQNRFLRLPATFISSGGDESRTNSYGNALWQGIFDASYTRVSDYLVTSTGTFFVVVSGPFITDLMRSNEQNDLHHAPQYANKHCEQYIRRLYLRALDNPDEPVAC